MIWKYFSKTDILIISIGFVFYLFFENISNLLFISYVCLYFYLSMFYHFKDIMSYMMFICSCISLIYSTNLMYICYSLLFLNLILGIFCKVMAVLCYHRKFIYLVSSISWMSIYIENLGDLRICVIIIIFIGFIGDIRTICHLILEGLLSYIIYYWGCLFVGFR